MSTLTTVTVTVTAKHIEAGIPNTCEECPVALALEEIFPDCGVTVDPPACGSTLIHLPAGGGFIKLELPREAGLFIDRFDEKSPVEPFTFTATAADAGSSALLAEFLSDHPGGAS